MVVVRKLYFRKIGLTFELAINNDVYDLLRFDFFLVPISDELVLASVLPSNEGFSWDTSYGPTSSRTLGGEDLTTSLFFLDDAESLDGLFTPDGILEVKVLHATEVLDAFFLLAYITDHSTYVTYRILITIGSVVLVLICRTRMELW